jgi:dethiobiotin synthase
MRLPNRVFITGTDTDVGKTIISCLLMAGMRAAYWKPIQSGMPADTDFVRTATGLPDKHFLAERYILTQPLSPHLSAARDGITIGMDEISLPDPLPEKLIVEGAGGVLVPLNDRHTMLDLMVRLGLPVIVVARSTLGTINHTCLTVDKLRAARLDVLGVVMNGPLNPDNRRSIEKFARVPVLAEIEPLPEVSPQSLLKEFDKHFAQSTVA